MKLDPRHLVQLATIVEQQSFSRAAVQLGLTQPALSRNIRLMEERLGVPVLERTRGGVRPTTVGRQLTAHGAAIRAENIQAAILADSVSQGLVGEVRIGAPHLITEYVLPRLLLELTGEHPGLTFRVRTSIMSELLASIVVGDLDLAIGPVGAVERGSGLRVEVLREHRIALLARHGHPLSRVDEILPEHLRKSQWAAIGRQSVIRSQMDAALASVGISQISLVVECQSEAMLLRLISESDLLTMLPLAPIASLIAEERIADLPFRHATLSHPIGIVDRSASHPSELQQIVRDAVVIAFAQNGLV